MTDQTPSTGGMGGTVETSSTPNTPTTPSVTTPATPSAIPGPSSVGAAVDAPITDGPTAADLKQDGTLRKATINQINEGANPRGGERSYNEVTDETTVTTNYGGSTVTFVEAGDTREPAKPRATDSAIRAMDSANAAKDDK